MWNVYQFTSNLDKIQTFLAGTAEIFVGKKFSVSVLYLINLY